MAPVMYSDATLGSVNGKTVQIIVCANEDKMLYCFREHKGHEGLKATPDEEYQQILVHDHDRTYYHYALTTEMPRTCPPQPAGQHR